MGNSMFIPGSEWVYFKIYTGIKTADTILKNELYGYVNEMLKNDIIDKWFFLRYYDPDFHIRLRLHLKDTYDFSYVFNSFYKTFYSAVNKCLIWNVQCDTYKREMVRYGANTISIIEDLFFNDSEFVIKLLHLLNEDNPNQHRWILSLVLIDSLLSAFSYELPQKQELLNKISNSYKKEFGFTRHHVTKQLNNKYRTYRKDIENAMLWENEITNVIVNIKRRRQAISSIAEELITMEKSGELQVSLNALLASLIHMTMTRWFRSKNRLHELVIYEFLSRFYTSEKAKKVFENDFIRKKCTEIDH